MRPVKTTGKPGFHHHHGSYPAQQVLGNAVRHARLQGVSLQGIAREWAYFLTVFLDMPTPWRPRSTGLPDGLTAQRLNTEPTDIVSWGIWAHSFT